MTYQETIWQGRLVWIAGIRSNNGKLHRYVANFVGLGGLVTKEAKNGMLLVLFSNNTTRALRTLVRAISAGCLTAYNEAKWSKL